MFGFSDFSSSFFGTCWSLLLSVSICLPCFRCLFRTALSLIKQAVMENERGYSVTDTSGHFILCTQAHWIHPKSAPRSGTFDLVSQRTRLRGASFTIRTIALTLLVQQVCFPCLPSKRGVSRSDKHKFVSGGGSADPEIFHFPLSQQESQDGSPFCLDFLFSGYCEIDI